MSLERTDSVHSIFRGRLFDIAVWTGIAVATIWTISFFFANVFQCWPIETNWTGWGNVHKKCIHVNQMIIAQAYTDIFTDVLILSLPLPNIWVLQIPPRHKVAISLIFLLGALTVCTGVAKLVVFYDVVAAAAKKSTIDVTYVSTPVIYWAMVESSLGVVGACLPLMRPLVAGTSPSGFLRSLRSIVFPSSRHSDSTEKSEVDARYNDQKYKVHANEQSTDAALSPDLWRKFGSEDRTLVGDVQSPRSVFFPDEGRVLAGDALHTKRRLGIWDDEDEDKNRM